MFTFIVGNLGFRLVDHSKAVQYKTRVLIENEAVQSLLAYVHIDESNSIQTELLYVCFSRGTR
jgi:hypothetical protein